MSEVSQGIGIDWSAAIAPHVRHAYVIYDGAEMGKVAACARLRLGADGSNTASCEQDVERYLRAVESTLGMVAGVSANLTVKNKIRELRRGRAST